MTRFASVLLMFVVMAGAVAAQDDATGDIDPRLQEQIETIEANTITIRELAPQADVTVYFPTRAELRAYLLGVFDAEYSQEVAEQDRLFYAAFGFVDPEIDLRNTLLDFYETQIGGFYDTDTQEMNVILLSGEEPGRFLPLFERIIYAHEFVHALQDQYFDLDTLLDDLDALDNADEYLATFALVEGDASYVMNLYTLLAAQANPLGTALQALGGLGQSPESFFVPQDVPAIISEELLWPYTAGATFVEALFAEGGWELVNAAYANPPQSSEQVMFPQRYLDGDLPIEVELASNLELLSEDWLNVRNGVLGAFHLEQFLLQGLERSDTRPVVLGWGGSRYSIYENQADKTLAWELRLAWDTAEDGFEFADALGQFAEAQFDELAETVDNRFCWSREDATMCALFDGAMSSVTQAPTLQDAAILLDN